MAKDDMEIVMYKILRYLYECMKNGREPDLTEYGWESKIFSIPKEYWICVIVEAVEKGYVKGFLVIKSKGITQVELKEKPVLTMEGRQFLLENSLMKKIKDDIKESFSIVLSGIFGIIG